MTVATASQSISTLIMAIRCASGRSEDDVKRCLAGLIGYDVGKAKTDLTASLLKASSQRMLRDICEVWEFGVD